MIPGFGTARLSRVFCVWLVSDLLAMEAKAVERSDLPASYVAQLDELVRKMQTKDAQRAVDALFEATPLQLGEGAVRGAHVTPTET